MVNYTLDVFWITFMPMYQHSIGGLTVFLSTIALYLMIIKTPEQGKPLARYLTLMQIFILSLDIVWGFLLCPVYLFPVTAFLCFGVLCDSPTTRHIGTVLLFQCMAQVAMSVFLTLHYKFVTIACMSGQRQCGKYEKLVVRLLFCLVLEVPVFAIATSAANQQELYHFLIDQKQFSLASMLTADRTKLHGVAISMPSHFGVPIVVPIIASLCISGAACSYFGFRTLAMLGKKSSSTMCEKTRKMQQRLMNLLLMQLGIPLGIQLVPIFICVASQTFSIFNPEYTNAALCLQLCHASFHTLFLMLTTPSYRNALTAPCRSALPDLNRRRSVEPM